MLQKPHMNISTENKSLYDKTFLLHQEPRYHFISLHIVILLLVLILIVDFIGNSLAVVIIIVERKMQSFSNWLILNLAIADLCVAIFCIPFEIPLELTEKWIYGKFFCTILYPIESATIYASVFTLVVLSYVRYRAIIHPYLTQPNRRVAKQSICAVWTISILCVTPYMLGLQYDSKSDQCIEVWTNPVRNVYTIATFTMQYVLPISIIILAYGFVIYEIIIKKNPSATLYDHKKRKNEDKKLIKLLIVITITFAVCDLPYHIVALCIEFGDAGSYKYIEDVSILSYVFLYLNSALNPILYNVFSSNFRSALNDIYKRSILCFWSHNEKCIEEFRKKASTGEYDDEKEMFRLKVIPPAKKLSQTSYLSNVHDEGGEFLRIL